MAREMVWLSGIVTYAQAAVIFERIGHRAIPRTSIYRQTQRHGERLRQYQATQNAHVRLERTQIDTWESGSCRGVSMDGGMVHIRDEGWKEIKVGTVFVPEVHSGWDARLQEETEIIQTRPLGYVGVLGNVEAFSPALWGLAVQHQLPTTDQVVVVADGAEWIWNLSQDLFPESHEIVDWYHACQHLAEAAQTLHPASPEQCQQWYRHRQHNLFLGQLAPIIEPLQQAHQPEVARYFQTHRHRMRYHEFRENRFPIGSGMVESGIKQFKTRLTGAGMRWSRPAAERMLIIRAAILSDTFDHLWLAA